MKRWQFWLGILISVAFLVWAASKLHLGDVWTAMKSANYIWLVPGVAVWFVGLFVRTWRWHYMLRPLKKISTWKMFPVVAIGYFGNNVYPARAGEVLRAYVLRKREGVPISASLATVIVERIFDGVVMLAFVFLNLGQLENLTQESGFLGDIRTLAIVGAAIFLGALLIFLLAAMFPRVAERITHWLVERLLPSRLREKTEAIAFKFLAGLESLRNPQTALMIFFTSVIIWLFETLKYWFVMHAFPGLEVSFFALMLMNGIVNLATTLPSAPGYIGTFDAPGIAVLTAYGVGLELATAYTLVLHAALWFPITLLGAYYFSREGLKWSADYRSEVDAERAKIEPTMVSSEKK